MLTCAFVTCNAKHGGSKTLPGPGILQEISTAVTHVAESGLQGSLARDRACGTCGNDACCLAETECFQQ